MKVDREEARRIAELARIRFDEPALDAMAGELTAILTYIDQLRDVETDDSAEEETPLTPMREDEPHQPLDRAAVEANAPLWRDGFFVVPKVLGGD